MMMITGTSGSLVEVFARRAPPRYSVQACWLSPCTPYRVLDSREPIGAEIRSRFPNGPGVSLAFSGTSPSWPSKIRRGAKHSDLL